MNEEIRVARMAPYSECESLPDFLGGLGGWFKPGMRWADFIATVHDTAKPYAEAFREKVIELGIREGGDWHQSDACGCPVFSDGTTALFSYRAWGDIMAAIWSEHDGKDYGYMDFYMFGR